MIVEVSLEVENPRPPYEAVAGYALGEGGASPRGSTYGRRVQSCAREHLLSNVLKWERLPRAKALDMGLLWHGVLEHYYLGVQAQQQGQRLAETPETSAFRFLQRFRSAPGWAEFYETATRMFDSYLTRWRNADQEWQILAVECTLGWTLESHPHIVEATGFELTTRLDMNVIDHTLTPVGRHIEHKSSYALDPQTVTAYSLDDQLFGQCYLGRYWLDWQSLGVPYVGALVNVTTKAKSPKNVRLPVQPSDVHLAAWAASKRHWYLRRQQYEGEGFPKNFCQCTRRFGRCSFFEFCRTEPTLTAVDLCALDARDDLPLNVVKLRV